MPKMIFGFLALMATLAFAACGTSEPEFYHCQYDAELAVKRQLNFPATFDLHSTDTTRAGMDVAIITGDEVEGWRINAPLIFGAENAFGVKSDYRVFYTANVQPDGTCWGVTAENIQPYIRR